MSDITPETHVWASRLWIVIRVGLALFLLLNLYALSLRFLHPPTTILMLQRSASGETIRQDWTPLSEISPYIVQAVMAGEDSRFCEHEGIDWAAIEQAFEENQNGGRRRGGSTITQQTAKNVFFWNGGGYLRKAGEAWFASLIDYTWGKSRVMEVYLNVAEWGDGIFGIEAAAQNRFGKSAKDITWQEAALLAAVLPSPNKWRLDPPSDFVRGRARTLRKRMTVIDGSAYDKCVPNLAEVKNPPQIPPIQTSPKSAAPPDTDANTDLENVLKAAEEAIEESDNMARPPTEIPPVDPSTVPKTPDEIAPNRPSEVPQENPQEYPQDTPPNEVPQQPDEYP